MNVTSLFSLEYCADCKGTGTLMLMSYCLRCAGSGYAWIERGCWTGDNQEH